MDLSIILKAFASLAPTLIKGKNHKYREQVLVELNCVYETLESLNVDNNSQADLMAIRGHLESALPLFKKTIYTWNIWDKDKVLYPKYTEYNKLCILLACVYSKLDDEVKCRKTLLEKLCIEGDCEVSLKDIPNIEKITPSGLKYTSRYFYSKLLGTSYAQFEEYIWNRTKEHQDSLSRNELDDEIDLIRIHMDL